MLSVFNHLEFRCWCRAWLGKKRQNCPLKMLLAVRVQEGVLELRIRASCATLPPEVLVLPIGGWGGGGGVGGD